MKVVNNTRQELEILGELPPFIVWFMVGRYFLTQRTSLWLNADENKVRMRRTTLVDAKEYQFPLEHLDSAEVQQNRAQGHGSGARRTTSGLNLVFSNTRPATRVPLAAW